MAPVVMAISGAAGSIYVSRISTSLHSSSKEHYLIVALALFALTCPVLYLFLGLTWITGQVPVTFLFAMGFLVAVALQASSITGARSVHPILILPAPFLQVAISITLAYHLTHLLWRLDYDPDGEPWKCLCSRKRADGLFRCTVYCLPLLSSFLDVTGQLLLVGAFALAGKAVRTPEPSDVADTIIDAASQLLA